jgi:hypothetical protein
MSRGIVFGAIALRLAGCSRSALLVDDFGRAQPTEEDASLSDAGFDDAAAAVDAPPPPPPPPPPPAEAGTDAGSPSLLFAAGQNNPLQIAADDRHVYWTNAGTQSNAGVDGAVLRAPVSGGAPTTLWVGPAFAVALDVASVYFTGRGSIMSMPLDGGSVTTLVSGQAGGPDAIASDGASLYWVSSSPSSIRKIPVAGGTPVVLATGLASINSVAVDHESVYWGEALNAPDGGDGAVWIKSVPVGGGTPAVLFSSPASGGDTGVVLPPTVTVRDPDVYATFPDVTPALGLARLATGGGTPYTLAPSIGVNLAVDDAAVYWTVSELASVFRLPVAGGLPETIAAGQPGAGAVAVNGASVFWTVSNGGNVYGAIMKAPK